MRQVSRKRAAMQRIRGRLVRRTEPQACEWCHAEPAVDTHELVRRSQRRDAMIDLDVMIPIGRACHDWATTHPAAAVDRGMAMWYWQAAYTTRIQDDVADKRVVLTVRVDPEDVEWLDARAAERSIDRSETVRRIITAVRRQAGGLPPPITDPAATGGSTSPRSDHPPSARPYPKPSAGGKG